MNRRREIKAITDVNYGELIGAKRYSRAAAGFGKIISAINFCRLSHGVDLIITSQGARSVTGLVLLSLYLALTKQKKLILVEFLPGRRGRLVSALYRWALPRAVLRAQIMTAWEKIEYSRAYGFASDQLVHIPFYYFDDRILSSPARRPAPKRPLIMSSGRNSCDWGTLLHAAEGQNWNLVIISKDDEVERWKPLADSVGARMVGTVPRAEHDQLMDDAAVFVLSLKQTDKSAGHIRLMSSATFGVPVIATRSRGIEGYEHLATQLVPVGDVEAMRARLNEAISDLDAFQAQQERVRTEAEKRPFSLYAEELKNMFAGALKVKADNAYE